VKGLVTVQQHHIFGRSARLTYTGYAAPDRLPKSAAPLPDGLMQAISMETSAVGLFGSLW